MSKNKRINDPYTNKARQENLVARSYYKLEEINNKFGLFNDSTRTVIDIGCAPGSWLQYISQTLEQSWKVGTPEPTVIGFDLKQVTLTLPFVHAYQQDITEREVVAKIMESHHQGPGTVDVIVSDMAPDTIGMKDIDALRSIGLIEKTLRMYDTYLKEGGTFAIKVFMGPGFDELVRDLKTEYGASAIQVFKPKSCRKESKETYIVKRK